MTQFGRRWRRRAGSKRRAALHHRSGAAPRASQTGLSGRKKLRMRPKNVPPQFAERTERGRKRRIPAPLNVMDNSYTGQVSRVVELLQGKWTVQILCAMRTRPVRLSELKRAIPSASKKALTASLRSLEAGRVVLRRDLSSSVLHVEYELAAAMREPLVTLLDHLAEWGKLYDSEKLSTIPLSAPNPGESNLSTVAGYGVPMDKTQIKN